MIYEYLDKWLRERCRAMEILLSYGLHRTRHVGFSDHLNLLAGRRPRVSCSDTQSSFLPLMLDIWRLMDLFVINSDLCLTVPNISLKDKTVDQTKGNIH